MMKMYIYELKENFAASIRVIF